MTQDEKQEKERRFSVVEMKRQHLTKQWLHESFIATFHACAGNREKALEHQDLAGAYYDEMKASMEEQRELVKELDDEHTD